MGETSITGPDGDEGESRPGARSGADSGQAAMSPSTSHRRVMRLATTATALATAGVLALSGCSGHSGSKSSSSSSDGLQVIPTNRSLQFSATTEPAASASIMTFSNGLKARASLNAAAVDGASGSPSLPTTLAGRFKAPTGSVLVPLALGINSGGVKPTSIASSSPTTATITFTLRYGTTKIPLTNDLAFSRSIIASVPKAQVNNLRIDVTFNHQTKTVDLFGRSAH